jgi:Domain of unknown function (DUF4926)
MRRSAVVGGTPPSEITQDVPSKPSAFVELARVTLARPVSSEEGQVAAGATGTIVHVWSSGTACEVEFTKPFQAVATVKANDITE